MNLEDAIKHCEEVAEGNYKLATAYHDDRNVYMEEEAKCVKCADEYMQLAEWLRDYKRLKEQEPCEDAVSRKALISHIENQSREWGEDYDAQQILGDIEDLPSVNPQEKTGHWIIMGDRYIKCSECGHITKTESPDIYHFCMVCGVKMSKDVIWHDKRNYSEIVVEPQESEG